VPFHESAGGSIGLQVQRLFCNKRPRERPIAIRSMFEIRMKASPHGGLQTHVRCPNHAEGNGKWR
jgi:hypothetical protein